MHGGLGNQMFQYNFYRILKEKGFDVKFDVNHYLYTNDHNGLELDKVFAVDLPLATKKQIKRMRYDSYNFLGKLKSKLLGSKKTHIMQEDFFIKLLSVREDLYLDGYWQNRESFTLSDSIADFTFKESIPEQTKELMDSLRDKIKISLHVRRGDYLNKNNLNHFANCDLKYYSACIEFFEQNFSDLTFIILSNDIAWCKKNLKFNSTSIFIDNYNKDRSYEDMRLMTLCDHNIIANSSFSWWGAYLNKNQNKQVLVPENWWKNPDKANDIYIPMNWKKIANG